MKEGLKYMLEKHPYLTVLLVIPLAVSAAVDGVQEGVRLAQGKKDSK